MRTSARLKPFRHYRVRMSKMAAYLRSVPWSFGRWLRGIGMDRGWGLGRVIIGRYTQEWRQLTKLPEVIETVVAVWLVCCC